MAGQPPSHPGCAKTSLLPLGADVGSAMSMTTPHRRRNIGQQEEHRAAQGTPPTNSGDLFLPLVLQPGVGEMLSPSTLNPLNSRQARETSEKAILYPPTRHLQPPSGHSSKEESDKLGPSLLGTVSPERAAGRIIAKIGGFVRGDGAGRGGILPVQSVWGYAGSLALCSEALQHLSDDSQV